MGDSPTIIDAQRERRLDDLLLAVFEQTEAQRKSFLERACDGDETLLADALDHLAVEKDLGDFLERPAALDMPGIRQGVGATADITLLEAGGANVDATTVLDFPGESSDGLRRELESLGRDHLGNYEIVGYAGRGGMGEVYIGEDRSLRRQVAIKTLPRELAERPGWFERFQQEARALGTLNHPNIVTIYSIEEDAGIHFLTMELVEGKTLREDLPEDGLPLDDLLRIAVALTSALEAAHERGVIHRDLKPANVMTTEDGRVKVLDFGIAKISGEKQVSEDGRLIGTVPYMAPEQLRGEKVDARCDLFSFAVLLYQLASGEHPFPASSAFRRVSAILWHEPQPLAGVRPDLPIELVAILDRCLAKDPAERYQTAAEVSLELGELRDKLLAEKLLGSRTDLRAPSRDSASQGRQSKGSKSVWFALGAVGLALSLWAVAVLRDPSPMPAATMTNVEASSGSLLGASQVAERTAVAVLYFDNLTDDPELRWLSSGLPELLITDLAQSSELAVLGAGRMYRILDQLGTLEEQELSPEMVLKIAEQGQAEVVIRGHFARLGEKTLGVTFSIEDPYSGQVLSSESLEGQGVESVFGLIDQMSVAVLETLQATRPGIGPQTIGEATTLSLPAWKAFAEAQSQFLQGNQLAAMQRWEDAIEIDPRFAMAYAQLARVYADLGYADQGREAAAKAVELAERLPLNNRMDVEASFYEASWATTGRAIETYRIGLGLYPQKRSWRNNLARLYATFEKYDDAIEELDQILAEGTDFIGTYSNAGLAYAALGRYEKAYEVLTGFGLDSKNWVFHFSRGYLLTGWGQLDQAAEAYDQSAALQPNNHYTSYGRWRIEVLQGDWQQADAEAQHGLDSDDAFARWRGAISLAHNALYRGNSSAAVAFLDQAIADSAASDQARARCIKAEVLSAGGEFLEALEEASRAQRAGIEQWPELQATFLAAQIEEAFGRHREADAHLITLEESWRRQPNAIEERQLLILQGKLHISRGEVDEARAVFERAARLLPQRGVEFSWHVLPDHVPVWLALAELELAAERPKVALSWLERIMSSGSEHLEHPIPYVQSFYWAGVALAEMGEDDEARRRFETFLNFWSEGDLHREWVDNASKYLAGGSP